MTLWPRTVGPATVLAAGIAAVAVGCSAPARPSATAGFAVVARYPHATDAYTEGLVFHDGALYESTGRYGESSLRQVELETGRVTRRLELPGDLFGEGLALLDERLYQVTWREHVALVYAVHDLSAAGSFGYAGEGWGLTTDGDGLIMSNGSNELRWLDPATGHVLRSVSVTDEGEAVEDLNELEWIGGEIWANVWRTERIVRIDPDSGLVTGSLDLGALRTDELREDDLTVLNGIAFDADAGRIFVTGKLWPTLYEIELSGAD